MNPALWIAVIAASVLVLAFWFWIGWVLGNVIDQRAATPGDDRG